MIDRHPREIESEAHFRAYLLGTRRLYVGPELMDTTWIPRTRAWEVLFWFLLNPERPFLAETLVEQLWPEVHHERAVSTFQVCVHAVRRAIEPSLSSRCESRFLRRHSNNVYSFEPGDQWWTDVAEVEMLDRTGHHYERAGDTIRARYYYRRVAGHVAQGHLLLNDDWPWVHPYRERLRQLCLRSLNRLMLLEEDDGTDEDLLEAAHLSLNLEPRNHMAVKAQVLQFLMREDCVSATARLDEHFDGLHRELGLRPPEEFLRLRQVLSGPAPSSAAGRRDILLAFAGRGPDSFKLRKARQIGVA